MIDKRKVQCRSAVSKGQVVLRGSVDHRRTYYTHRLRIPPCIAVRLPAPQGAVHLKALNTRTYRSLDTVRIRDCVQEEGYLGSTLMLCTRMSFCSPRQLKTAPGWTSEDVYRRSDGSLNDTCSASLVTERFTMRPELG